MAGIQNRTAAEVKAELSAAIQQSRALLGEAAGSIAIAPEPADDESLAPVEDFDFSTLSDEELEILLRETEPDPAVSSTPTGDLMDQIARNPLPWAIGALVVGTIGAQGLLGGNSAPKNPRQNASQMGDSSITHGSLIGQIMKSAFEMAKPTLLEAAQGCLTRFVEKKP